MYAFDSALQYSSYVRWNKGSKSRNKILLCISVWTIAIIKRKYHKSTVFKKSYITVSSYFFLNCYDALCHIFQIYTYYTLFNNIERSVHKVPVKALVKEFETFFYDFYRYWFILDILIIYVYNNDLQEFMKLKNIVFEQMEK